MTLLKTFFLSLILISINTVAQKLQTAAFQVVPLGIKGGIDEKNLSSYLLAPSNTTDFISLDA
jgi:cAMP phosphodiesterase